MKTPVMAAFLILTTLPLVSTTATHAQQPAPPPRTVSNQDPSASEPTCRDHWSACLSDATRARNACIATCQPQRDAVLQACGGFEDTNAQNDSDACTQTRGDYQSCTDPCETRFRGALSALHVERASETQAEIATRAARTVLQLAGERDVHVGRTEIRTPPVADLTASPAPRRRPVSISRFDRLIVHHAKTEGFDWLLIAALIFEESRFNPDSRSAMGAVGLMQVRPIAAEAVGAAGFKAPDENVRTGLRYLRYLDRMFQAARGRDRLGLVLAAYNMGPGHVRDAQVLARRFGYDPNRWDNEMDQVLPLLEHPRLYTQVANGFAKGRETVGYVQRTLERYRRYQRAMLDADPLSGLRAAGDGEDSTGRRSVSRR
jgi:transglycosylase-like protein with SLT domain